MIEDDETTEEEGKPDFEEAGEEFAAGASSRKEAFDGATLNPATLMGSYFIKFEGDEPRWWGQVVGQVADMNREGPVLLMNVELAGQVPYQRAVAMVDLIGSDDDGFDWRFYDTDEHMRQAFAEAFTVTREEV